MNKIKYLSLIIIFIGTYHSQAQKNLSTDLDHSFISSLSAGLLFPTGNFSDLYKTGFSLGLSVGYLFNPNIGARLNVGYGSNSYTSNYSYITGGTLHQIPVKGDLLYGAFNNSQFYPYGIFSLGEYFFNYSDYIVDGVNESIPSESGFGVSIGGGVGYKLSPLFSVFAETQFNKVFTTGNSTNFVTLNAGISYKFATREKHGKKPDEQPTAHTPPPNQDLNTFDAGIGKYGICLTKCPKNFVPEGINYVCFTAKIYRCTGTGWVPSTDPSKITFTLHNVSQEPGHCMNFGKTKTPDLYFPKLSEENPGNDCENKFIPPGSGGDDDVYCEKIIAGQNNPHHTGHWQSITTKSPETEITVVVRSEDYGPFGWIEATAEGCVQIPAREDSLSEPPCPKNKCCAIKHGSYKVQTEWNVKNEVENNWVKIPRDDNQNGIANICGQDSCGADFKNAVKDDDDNPSNNNKGDGLTAYQEYRGFMVEDLNGDGSTTQKHIRTSIKKKDIFILDKNKSFKVSDYEYFQQSELELHFIYDQKLMGAMLKDKTVPGQEKGPADEKTTIPYPPGSEINYNRKSYSGNIGYCAQHCISIIKSDDFIKDHSREPEIEGTLKTQLPKFFGLVTTYPPSKTSDGVASGTDDGSPGIPSQIYYVIINYTLCTAESHERLMQIIAHELGHAVNIKHHGEGNPHNHKVIVSKKTLFPNFFYMNSVTSGNDNCIMRYDHKGWGWCEKGCEKNETKIHVTYWDPIADVSKERIGTTFCDSKTGTGVNSVVIGNRTITNDAKEGNCKGQIKVKDW